MGSTHSPARYFNIDRLNLFFYNYNLMHWALLSQPVCLWICIPLPFSYSLTHDLLACRTYRRPYDSSICLHTSGVLSGNGTGLVGPARVITSLHDGYRV